MKKKAKKKKKKKAAVRTVKKRANGAKKPLARGKNAKGQFTKGNSLGTRSRTAAHKHKEALSKAFNAAVKVKDITEIAEELVKIAKKGNVKAAQQVLDRCLGKVVEKKEIGGLDGGPVQVQIVNYAGASKK